MLRYRYKNLTAKMSYQEHFLFVPITYVISAKFAFKNIIFFLTCWFYYFC